MTELINLPGYGGGTVTVEVDDLICALDGLTLASKLRVAADVMIEVAQGRGVVDCKRIGYTAQEFLDLADELDAMSAIDPAIEEFAEALCSLGVAPWKSLSRSAKDEYRNRARQLIDQGWRKS